MSRAAIARIEGVSWNAADRWVSKANVYVHRFNDLKTQGVELVELQADELRTFAQNKRRPTWVFTCMEVCSRLWMSTVVVRRSYRNTHALLNDTLARGEVIDPPLIMTDGFKFYGRVIRQLLGVACVYAQVVKTWRKDRVVKVESRPIIGTWRRLEAALQHSQDSVKPNTASIERLNLTLRQSLAYLARRSPCHAHREARLRHHLELARFYYNLVRRHAALKFGSCMRTPAMVAGLSHRLLAFRDVFAPVVNNT
jgi:IS1 family transposase